jgi:hypothetical protein
MALPLVFGSDIHELAEFFDRCRVKRQAFQFPGPAGERVIPVRG